MGKKKPRGKGPQEDLAHVRVIQDALLANDVASLRKAASALGLDTAAPHPSGRPALAPPSPSVPSSPSAASAAALGPRPSPGSLRSRAWMALAGLAPLDADADAAYAALVAAAAACAPSELPRDAAVIDVDIARSLWDWVGDRHRDHWRSALHRVLTALCLKHEGRVSYYQGMHDIAAVLVLTTGEHAAFRILDRLATSLLRDYTQPSLEPAARALALLPLLLAKSDPPLAAHLQGARVQPFYALPWLLCWFSHDLKDLGEVRRLFDLFLASHPLMPLYVAAAMIHLQRARILAADGTDPAEVHHALAACPALNRASAHELCLQAVFLFRQHPPAALVPLLPAWKRTGVAAFTAELQAGRWAVREPEPTRPRGPGDADDDEYEFIMPSATGRAEPGSEFPAGAKGSGSGSVGRLRALDLAKLSDPLRRAVGSGALLGMLLYGAGVAVVSRNEPPGRLDLNPLDDVVEAVRNLALQGMGLPQGLGGSMRRVGQLGAGGGGAP